LVYSENVILEMLLSLQLDNPLGCVIAYSARNGISMCARSSSTTKHFIQYFYKYTGTRQTSRQKQAQSTFAKPRCGMKRLSSRLCYPAPHLSLPVFLASAIFACRQTTPAFLASLAMSPASASLRRPCRGCTSRGFAVSDTCHVGSRHKEGMGTSQDGAARVGLCVVVQVYVVKPHLSGALEADAANG